LSPQRARGHAPAASQLAGSSRHSARARAREGPVPSPASPRRGVSCPRRPPESAPSAPPGNKATSQPGASLAARGSCTSSCARLHFLNDCPQPPEMCRSATLTAPSPPANSPPIRSQSMCTISLVACTQPREPGGQRARVEAPARISSLAAAAAPLPRAARHLNSQRPPGPLPRTRPARSASNPPRQQRARIAPAARPRKCRIGSPHRHKQPPRLAHRCRRAAELAALPGPRARATCTAAQPHGRLTRPRGRAGSRSAALCARSCGRCTSIMRRACCAEPEERTRTGSSPTLRAASDRGSPA
jgi:hypothetical protein